MSAEELEELKQQIMNAGMPEGTKDMVLRELQKLRKLSADASAYANLRTYIETMVDLPWNITSEVILDLKKSTEDLNQEHYGMFELKKRVLKYVGMRQLIKGLRGPILCLVGPPGVGKSSIGKSIARSFGREFQRVSLGGTYDQSSIRGHQRVYFSAMPGCIILGLRSVKVKNPVFLLDEVDKMGRSAADALLEVLDPEVNSSFIDRYINAPFDLSQVLFIATANRIASIPTALLDRMELIHVPGYTHYEKKYIAINHLIPRMLKSHELNDNILRFSEEAIKKLILDYTLEAGVRSLERKVAVICEAVALQRAEDNQNQKKLRSTHIDPLALEQILGAPVYVKNIYARLTRPGVAIGLVCNVTEGDIALVEASKMNGTGKLILTGLLGDIMKESGSLALNLVRSIGSKYGIDMKTMFNDIDVHIHFPAGSVEKDGTSAGITIVTALVSLFSGCLVRPDITMTGEVTLHGLVLPVGGIKEKVLATQNYGLKQVILPKQNEKDVEELTEGIKSDMKFHLVSHIDEVLKIALIDKTPENSKNSKIQSQL